MLLNPPRARAAAPLLLPPLLLALWKTYGPQLQLVLLPLLQEALQSSLSRHSMACLLLLQQQKHQQQLPQRALMQLLPQQAPSRCLPSRSLLLLLLLPLVVVLSSHL